MKRSTTSLVVTSLALLMVVAGCALLDHRKLQGSEERPPERPPEPSHLAEGLSQAGELKDLVHDYWAEHGSLPCSDEELGNPLETSPDGAPKDDILRGG